MLAFASRRLRLSEKNSSLYSSTKLEFLAMKWAITDKFRNYLLGGKFKVITDNNPLTYFRSAKLDALEQRWASQLAQFDFDIQYRPGKINPADALYRMPLKPSPEPLLSQAFISMLASRGTVLVRGCIGYPFDGLLSQLLDALHPF